MRDKLVCPGELSGTARAEWHRLTQTMIESHLLSQLDRGTLMLWCESFALWSQAVAELKKGAVISDNGQQNAWLAVANKQGDKLMRLAKELGFTPRSRRAFLPIEHANDLALEPRPTPSWDGKNWNIG
jgi:P27 family predicted phage terminase small subunit